MLLEKDNTGTPSANHQHSVGSMQSLVRMHLIPLHHLRRIVLSGKQEMSMRFFLSSFQIRNLVICAESNFDPLER
jgi:hypothetical protein